MKKLLLLTLATASLVGLSANIIAADQDFCPKLENLGIFDASTVKYQHGACKGTASISVQVQKQPKSQITPMGYIVNLTVKPSFTSGLFCGNPETDHVQITDCSNNGNRLNGTISENGGTFNIAGYSHINGKNLHIGSNAVIAATFTAPLNH